MGGLSSNPIRREAAGNLMMANDYQGIAKTIFGCRVGLDERLAGFWPCAQKSRRTSFGDAHIYGAGFQFCLRSDEVQPDQLENLRVAIRTQKIRLVFPRMIL